MGKMSDDELERLLGNRAVVDDEHVRVALAAVRESIESSASRRAVKPLYRRRWVTAGVATAAVGVASLVGVTTLTGGAGGSRLPLSVSSAAAAQLKRVAHAAAAQPGVSAGQWEYVEVMQYPRTSGSLIAQHWFGANGIERERATAHGTIIGDLVQPYPSSGGDEGSPPSDPQKLLSDIVGDQLPGANTAYPDANPVALWGALSNLLFASTSPQLRSTAFAALSYLPGTEVLGGQTDPLGRSGTAISFTDPRGGVDSEESQTLVVSPSTGEILEGYDTLTVPDHGRPAGTIVSRELFVHEAVVDSDTALPGGGTQPLPTSSNSETTTATATSPAITAPVAGTAPATTTAPAPSTQPGTSAATQ